MQPPEEQVGIGHSQGTALAIASRSRMSTSRFWANIELLVAVRENGATAGSDRVDVELRDLHRDTCSCRLEDMLIGPTEA